MRERKIVVDGFVVGAESDAEPTHEIKDNLVIVDGFVVGTTADLKR